MPGIRNEYLRRLRNAPSVSQKHALVRRNEPEACFRNMEAHARGCVAAGAATSSAGRRSALGTSFITNNAVASV